MTWGQWRPPSSVHPDCCQSLCFGVASVQQDLHIFGVTIDVKALWNVLREPVSCQDNVLVWGLSEECLSHWTCLESDDCDHERPSSSSLNNHHHFYWGCQFKFKIRNSFLNFKFVSYVWSICVQVHRQKCKFKTLKKCRLFMPDSLLNVTSPGLGKQNWAFIQNRNYIKIKKIKTFVILLSVKVKLYYFVKKIFFYSFHCYSLW